MSKRCCFIGHRTINMSIKELEVLQKAIESLIINEQVTIFLFGSKSEFNDICLNIVSKLKEKYPFIKRVFYACRSESCILENEKEKWQKIYSRYFNKVIKLENVVDEIIQFGNISSKASYVERNYTMIADSDYCMFYYNENYKPPLRKHSKHNLCFYQPKSGTALAYKQALTKRKVIINIAKESKTN